MFRQLNTLLWRSPINTKQQSHCSPPLLPPLTKTKIRRNFQIVDRFGSRDPITNFAPRCTKTPQRRINLASKEEEGEKRWPAFTLILFLVHVATCKDPFARRIDRLPSSTSAQEPQPLAGTCTRRRPCSSMEAAKGGGQ